MAAYVGISVALELLLACLSDLISGRVTNEPITKGCLSLGTFTVHSF
jgi:hypothetical protein